MVKSVKKPAPTAKDRKAAKPVTGLKNALTAKGKPAPATEKAKRAARLKDVSL